MIFDLFLKAWDLSNKRVVCTGWVFFLSFLSSKVAFGYDCATVLESMKSLNSHPIYDVTQVSSEGVWRKYLDLLDSDHLFLTAKESDELAQGMEGVEVVADLSLCQHINSLREKVAEKFSRSYRAYKDKNILSALREKDYNLESKSKIIFPFDSSERAKNFKKLMQLWKEFIVFKRLSLDEVSEEVFSQELEEVFAVLGEQISESFHGYILFIEALFKEVDPYNIVQLFQKEPKGFKLIYPFLNKEVHGVEGSEYILRILRWFGISFQFKNSFQHYIGVYGVLPRKVESAFSNYYDVQKSDFIVNYWKEREGSPQNLAVVLRLERDGFRWDHYRDMWQGDQGGKGFRQDILHNFVWSTSIEVDKVDVPSSSQTSTSLSGLQAPPRRPQSWKVNSDVLFLSLRAMLFTKKYYSTVSGEQISARDWLTESVLSLAHKSKIRSSDHPVMLLDLRSARFNLDLMKYLALTDAFLPHSPTAILQNKDETKVFGGRYTSNKLPRYQGPLVVLVDQDTHGYGELLAATFQERGRALVLGAGLGKRTSGRFLGSRMQRYDVADHPQVFIKFRAPSHFLWTAMGSSFLGKGVKPDITLPMERDVIEQQPRVPSYTHALPEIPSDMLLGKCHSSPLSADLIALLKKRSDQRLLSSPYPRSKLMNGKRVVEDLSFEQAFSASASDLASEKVLPSCEPQCSELSLSRQDFAEERKQSLLRTSMYQLEPNTRVGLSFLADVAMKDDKVLAEALRVAADYSYYGTHYRALNSSAKK